MNIKKETKRRSFVLAGARLFTKKGYSNVSVKAIVAEARASKVTFYNYFDSKEALFEAVVLEARYPALQRIGTLAHDGNDLRQILFDTGVAYLQMKLSPEVIATDRLVIAEAARLPALARLYHASGPSQTVAVLETLMGHLLERGLLAAEASARTMGLHFMSLCESCIYLRQVWGLDDIPNDEQLASNVKAAVYAFVGAYAAPAHCDRFPASDAA